MSDWHKNMQLNEEGAHCGTTHCWAGWIVAMGGKEARDLEERTSTVFAAIQINKASSPIRISPMNFYKNNAEAMLEIERCAQEEETLKAKQ